LFTRTNSGGTNHVWFYGVEADGWSLDDKRTELLQSEKLGPVPRVVLAADEHVKNNLPDVLARWKERGGSETKRPRTAQSFVIRKSEIVNQSYDLSFGRYKEMVHKEVAHRLPAEILASLGKLEEEIQQDMNELEGMLK